MADLDKIVDTIKTGGIVVLEHNQSFDMCAIYRVNPQEIGIADLYYRPSGDLNYTSRTIVTLSVSGPTGTDYDAEMKDILSSFGRKQWVAKRWVVGNPKHNALADHLIEHIGEWTEANGVFRPWFSKGLPEWWLLKKFGKRIVNYTFLLYNEAADSHGRVLQPEWRLSGKAADGDLLEILEPIWIYTGSSSIQDDTLNALIRIWFDQVGIVADIVV